MSSRARQTEALDRLTWAGGLTFSSFGVRIGIRVNRPNFAKSLMRVLPPGATIVKAGPVQRRFSLIVNDARSADGFNLLYDGSERLARLRELPPIIKFLEARIRRTVAEIAPRRVFVHAGVVGYRGRAIVIPGPTMSGKSTLVSELIRNGATYYSDEYAVFDDHGLVYPFPKPISLRRRGSFDSIDYSAKQFGASVGSKALPVGLILITRYVAGTLWRPRAVTHGKAALTLLSHAIAARRHPGRVMAAFRHALANSIMLKGVRGEASEMLKKLLELLDGEEEKREAAEESGSRFEEGRKCG